MSGKNKRDKSRLQIDGNVRVNNGDFIAGDKNVKVSKGGVIVRGNVKDSNIVTGGYNQVNNKEIVRETLFNDLIKKIEERPNTPSEDKEDLKTNIAEIKTEAEKAENADEPFLSRRFRNIERIAPDIADVMLATLTSPVAGFATVIKKVAERARKPKIT